MIKIEFSALLAESIEVLREKLRGARRELLKLRMGVKTGQEKDTSKYADQKKYIARVLTAIRSKEISEIIV